jgi:lipopolysaccharide/colanic/teichoic acid biosynthesis glycosyltransferase
VEGERPGGPVVGQIRPLMPVSPEDAAADWTRLAAENTAYRRWGARLFDTGLALALLPAAALFFLLAALINAFVFQDPRKVLYRQRRIGRHGVAFTTLKLRTLVPNEEDDFSGWLGGQDRQRVTAFGRWLRASHLDELPQLVSILRGEMAFVGPRPEMTEVHAWAAERVDRFHRRLAVRPGLTGGAQVNLGYAEGEVAAYREKLAADLRWIRSRNLATDLRIMARTLPWVLAARGDSPQVEARADGGSQEFSGA